MKNIIKILRVYKSFILSAILIIVCVCSIIFAFIPAVNSIQKYYIDNTNLSKENDQIKKRISALSSLSEADLKAKQDLLLSAIPYQKDIPSIITTLEKIYQETQITENSFNLKNIGSIATDSAEKKNTKNTDNIITIETQVSGNIESVINLLNIMSKSIRLLKVNEANVSFTKESGAIDTGLSIDAYTAPLPKTMGKPSDPFETLSIDDEKLMTKITRDYKNYLNTSITEPIFIPGTKVNPFEQFPSVNIETPATATPSSTGN